VAPCRHRGAVSASSLPARDGETLVVFGASTSALSGVCLRPSQARLPEISLPP
jgi:hypothetical protein